MALLKPNTRRKLPSTELNLDNSRGLISPSVRGLLLEFPHALRYGLNIERLLFLVFRYPIESIRFLRGCSLLYCRHHFTSLIDRQYRRILPVANQCIPSIPGKNKAAPLGRGLYPIFFGQVDLFFGSPLRGSVKCLTFQTLSQYNSFFRAASVNLFSGQDTLLQILTQATMVGRDL